MTHIDHIVNDIIGQIQLSITCKHRAYIGVYTARQNLLPVIETFISRINKQYQINTESLADVQNFLKASGLRIDIWQKPDPFKEKNHLTLTVGGLTAIIFDYEESVYVN
jgi:hypothetical protein